MKQWLGGPGQLDRIAVELSESPAAPANDTSVWSIGDSWLRPPLLLQHRSPRAAQRHRKDGPLQSSKQTETFGVKGDGKTSDNGLRKPRRWGYIPTGSTTLR